jgi:hypothetical protein
MLIDRTWTALLLTSRATDNTDLHRHPGPQITQIAQTSRATDNTDYTDIQGHR